jgi:hypothetical protein
MAPRYETSGAGARGRRGRVATAAATPSRRDVAGIAGAGGREDEGGGSSTGDEAASGSEGGGEEEYEPAVTLESLLAPLSLDEFCREYWGRKPYATRVDHGVLDQLRERFLDGEFGDVAATCRNDENARYTAEEIADLQAQVEAGRRTVCLPFCFAPGAIDIKRSFIDLMGSRGYGNDIEVGVYFSRIGCEPAYWHLDPNHNITIQLKGAKDWLLSPGDPHTLAGSRGMRDAPGNFLEQTLAIPNTGTQQRDCTSLGEGSLLYIPPGHWHSVVPSHGDSFSVDLRVATVTHAKWLSEVLFAHSQLPLRRALPSRPAALAPADYAPSCGSAPVLTSQAVAAGDAMRAAVHACPPLRAFPFQPTQSDGMVMGGTLQFLVAQNFSLPQPRATFLAALDAQAHVSVNPMVAIEPKKRDASELLLSLRSTSSLTGAEYLRYNLLCHADLLPTAILLVQHGRVPLSDLIPSSTRKSLAAHVTGLGSGGRGGEEEYVWDMEKT